MDFINKNANFFLVILILISVACLIGVTIYYQSSFSRLNTKYIKKVKKLEDISASLLHKESLLNQTQQDLTLKEAREEDFTEKYTEVKQEREDLAEEKTDLEQSKATLEKQLRDTRDQLTRNVKALQDSQRELSTSQSEVSKLKSDKVQLEDDLEAARRHADNEEDNCQELEDQLQDLGITPTTNC